MYIYENMPNNVHTYKIGILNIQPAIYVQTFIPHINRLMGHYQKPPLFSFNQEQILNPI